MQNSRKSNWMMIEFESYCLSCNGVLNSSNSTSNINFKMLFVFQWSLVSLYSLFVRLVRNVAGSTYFADIIFPHGKFVSHHA